MVRRRIDPDDARAIHVLLKPEGRAQAMRLIRTFDRLQKDFEKQIGTADLEAALGVLGHVEQLLATRAGHSEE